MDNTYSVKKFNVIKISIILSILLMILLPGQHVFAETLEERLNNLIGPEEQYNSKLSPVYLRNNATEESISPQTGELSLAQTDYVLPGRNGLDLELKRLYESGTSNVQDMKVEYVGGAWVDYIHSDNTTSSFYEDRYDLGIGMRFSFPAMEIKSNEDGTSHKFLHTEAGDIYSLKGPTVVDGVNTYLPEAQTVKDVVIKEDHGFSNGQSDGTSMYAMSGNNGKKTYFTDDGRVIGIVDRYGNTIRFEYLTQNYTIDGTARTKKLISKITDTVGRVVTIDYNEDYTYKVSPITDKNYNADETWKESENPNNTDSGDLNGKFQVVVHLPGDKTLVYDKSAVLVSSAKSVVRTRLQRVFDVDGKPKYHFWYEQTDLGFTYTNGNSYSVYNRYENLVQIDFCKTNKIKRYTYNSYKKGLSDNGSMQYRKIFAKEELIKKAYNPSSSGFLDRFACETKSRLNYTYTNEADGYGFSGYNGNDDEYLKNTYRYMTKATDLAGTAVTYTYSGLHELIRTEEMGNDHKQVVTSEYDQMKFPKKRETRVTNLENGKETGQTVKKIENYRYDQYGNLTNYTGPVANRDENGYPLDTEHTVIYSYDNDRYFVPVLKTWKSDKDTTCQVNYEVDVKGNVIRETKKAGEKNGGDIITDYQYDSYGNMIKKVLNSQEGDYITNYEFGVDLNGIDQKGAYLTKEYTVAGGAEIEKRYAYDPNTGGIIEESDGSGNRTKYVYDELGRIVKTVLPDQTKKDYQYIDNAFENNKILFTDAEGVKFLYEYDIAGGLVNAGVEDAKGSRQLKVIQYDTYGNKIKETDSNGNSTAFTYDSQNRLTGKLYYDKDNAKKAGMSLKYENLAAAGAALLLTITDEEGYLQKFYYDIADRLVKSDLTPDNKTFYTSTYNYDYTGNKIEDTDAKGGKSTYRYDGLGRLVGKTDAGGNSTSYTYNSNDQVLSILEPGDKVTQYVFDELGRVGMEKSSKSGSEDYTYKGYEYDGADKITAVRQGMRKNGVDTLLSEVTFTYNTLNLPTDEYRKISDGQKAHIHYSYDKNGRKTEVVQYSDLQETKAVTSSYLYDFAGRVIEESGEVSGLAGADSGSYIKKYEYDNEGNMVKQETLANVSYRTTLMKYDYRNRLLEKSEPYSETNTKTTRYQYDKKGNLISETLKIDGRDCITTKAYDGLGRLVRQTSPTGGITTYVYDPMNNLVKQITPAYAGMDAEDAPGMEYEYDALNRQIKQIAFNGSSTEVVLYRKYDARGNILLEAAGEGYNGEEPDASQGARFEYDIFNNVVKIISAQTAADNKKNGTANYTRKASYDGLNQLTEEEDAYGNHVKYQYYMDGSLKSKMYPNGTTESYVYDLTGKLEIRKTDRGGGITTTHNGLFGKPIRIEYPDGSVESCLYDHEGKLVEITGKAGYKTTFSYDPAGNIVSKKEYISSENGMERYRLTCSSYNEAGLMLSSESFESLQLKNDDASETLKSYGNRTLYSYDKAGNTVKITGPGESETVNAYDLEGRLVKQSQKVGESAWAVKRFEYDYRSRLVSETMLADPEDLRAEFLTGLKFDREYTDKVGLTSYYTYYSSGKLKSKKDAAANTTSYTYDLDGQVTGKTDPLMQATEYEYDLNGNLVEEKNARGFAVRYEYDEENRLIRRKAPSAEGGTGVTRYIYDGRGNLIRQIQPNAYDATLDTEALAETMKGVSYTYDSMNRRTTALSPDGKILEAIQYDIAGNVVKIADGLRYTGDMAASAGTSYRYDGLNQAVRIEDGLGQVTAYEYDILGKPVRQTDGNGNVTQFTYNGDGTLQKIIYADDSTIEYTYDPLGRKTSFKDQKGNVTTYGYNAFDKLKAAKDPLGFSVEYKYDLKGNTAAVTDKKGSTALYKYDAMDRLTEKRQPLTKDESGNITYAIEKYTYDEVGNVKSKTLTGTEDKQSLRQTSYTYYLNNLVDTVTDNSKAYTKNFYDKNGNVVKTEMKREEGLLDITRNGYDAMDRLVRQSMLVKEEEVFNADSLPNIQELRDMEYPGMLDITTWYEYDLLGNKTKEILPQAFGYEASNTTERAKYTIGYSYDALNRLKEVSRFHNGSVVRVQYEYDAVGNKTKTTDERGNATLYAYDGMNRLAKTTDAQGGEYSYIYNAAGNKLSETNAKGSTVSYTYDKLGRVLTVTDPFGVCVTTNVYDENGSLTETKDADGNETTFTYDLAGRQVSMTDPETAEKNAVTVTYAYNQYGETISEKDALGNITAYKYDMAGRVTEVADALGVVTKYSYDLAGNKLRQTDGRGKTTSYAYGAFGKLQSMTDAAGKSITYSYDLGGNAACTTDRNGNITVYTYDIGGRLLEKIGAASEDRIEYAYDAVGNRIGMTDESGDYTYTFDSLNWLEKSVKDGAAQLTYGYDTLGNVTSVTDSKGNTTQYTYDKAGRMEKASFDGKTAVYTYDRRGNRKTLTYPGGVSEEYIYDKNSRLLTLVNKNPAGGEISRYSYTYDLAGRQLTKTDSFGTSRYTYDKAGRVTKEEAPGRTVLYAFDKAGNRISLSETYASKQSSGFVDEGTGNEIEYILKKSQYVYTDANRLLKLVEEMCSQNGEVLLQKTVQYVYDNEGSELSQTASYILTNGGNLRKATKGSAYGDQQTSSPDRIIERTMSTYDSFNQLKKTEKLEDGVRTLVEYLYNGDGLRTQKTVKKSDGNYAPEVTVFLYDRQNVILETDGTGSVKTRYIKGINYIASITGGSVAYFLYNGHGDTVQTVNAEGKVQNSYDYDIFGNPTLTVETAACSIRYAGEYFDKETGLYYLRARYYDPYTGRFTTEDSYWGEDTNPLSLNLYTYCFNDPIRYTDPTGHMSVEEMAAQATKSAQVNWLISEINSSKEAWVKEEQGAGKNQAAPTETQASLHSLAESLRYELAKLETGNQLVANLVNSHGDDAVLWEGYQMGVTARNAISNPDVDYSEKIRQNAINYSLALVYGKNAVGIDANSVKEDIKMAAENYADEIVSAYQYEGPISLIFSLEDIMPVAEAKYSISLVKYFPYDGDSSTGKESLTSDDVIKSKKNLQTLMGKGSIDKRNLFNSNGKIDEVWGQDKGNYNQALWDFVHAYGLDEEYKKANYDKKTLYKWIQEAVNGKRQPKNMDLYDYFFLWGEQIGENNKQWGESITQWWKEFDEDPESKYNQFFDNAQKAIDYFVFSSGYDITTDMGKQIDNWFVEFNKADGNKKTKMIADINAQAMRDLDFAIAVEGILGEVGLSDDILKGTGNAIEGGTGFLSKPATSNGTLNIGAGSKPISGAYNIDINPSATGVYAGDATNLSGIVTGSQNRIVIQNPYNYNALNPEVSRVLQNGGTIEISGGMSNKWFNSIYKMSESELNSLGYSTVSRGQATSAGTGFTTQGEAIKSNIMEIVLKKIK